MTVKADLIAAKALFLRSDLNGFEAIREASGTPEEALLALNAMGTANHAIQRADFDDLKARYLACFDAAISAQGGAS